MAKTLLEPLQEVLPHGDSPHREAQELCLDNKEVPKRKVCSNSACEHAWLQAVPHEELLAEVERRNMHSNHDDWLALFKTALAAWTQQFIAKEEHPPKRQRGDQHSKWPGWKVMKMGKWDGYSIINVGGGMEWLFASNGSTLFTFQQGKMWRFCVEKDVAPNKGWLEFDADDEENMVQLRKQLKACMQQTRIQDQDWTLC